MQQNTTFAEADPLKPTSSVPIRVARAYSILLISLTVTLFVAFLAVLGKQWILYYTRATTWGNIVDRGKERQAKLAGLQKWRLRLIMESLPVMLQFSLLLFSVALAVYLWDLNVSIAEVVLVVPSIGLAFYIYVTASAVYYSDCPFQTPISILLLKIPPWAKEFTAPSRGWLKRKVTVAEHGFRSFVGRVSKILTGGVNVPNQAGEDAPNNGTLIKDPALWRNVPLFASPMPKDICASAGLWLLENSTDFSAASAVAALFSEHQWPPFYRSTTALVRLRDTYLQCFRAAEFAPIEALRSAAAYYVTYHARFIWITSSSLNVKAPKLPSGLVADLSPDLPPDLLLLHRDRWDGDDLFEHLLKTKDRSEPVTSAQFLSYIAPYWFFGNSDSTVKFRLSRLQQLYDLIKVLENSKAVNSVTLTNCILCAGVVMDFPLHPEDLVRVDKRCVPPPPHTFIMVLIRDSTYLVPTFEMVVEHIHDLTLARGRRRRHAKTALDILLILAKKARPLSLVDASWINGLLKSAARGNMDDDTFTLFLRLSARRKEEKVTADAATSCDGQYCVHIQGGKPETATPEYALFVKILQNIQTHSEQEGGWQDEAVYGGLLSMRDIPHLESFPPGGDFLRTLCYAMDKGKPFHVRKAAHDVILAARNGWLRSAELRQTLKDLDLPRQLHGVVIETGRADRLRSFLTMMEILSGDRYWHPYLRGTMDIWLPFRHDGPDQVLSILARVGELTPPIPEYSPNSPPIDKFLEKLMKDEWAAVPGRPAADLAPDRLKPLAEVTRGFKEQLLAELDRGAVLDVVEQVIPTLERRRGTGLEGPGEDIDVIVNDLLDVLREPIQFTAEPEALDLSVE